MCCPRRGINDALVAVQHIARAILFRGGAQVRKVIAPLRLGIGEGDDCIARDDFGDHRIGLGPADGLQRAARDDDGGKIGLDPDDLAEFFHHDRIFERPAAEAAMLFGKGRAQHAKLLRQCGPDRRIASAVAADELLARFEIIGVAKETRQRVADHVLRFGVSEIHCLPSHK